MSAARRPGAPRIEKVDGVSKYRVRRDGEWADIFIEAGTDRRDSGRPNNWVSVAIHSSFGAWGYHWTAIGARDWRAFLANLDIDYAFGKLAGVHLSVEDLQGTLANLREHIESLHLEGTIDVETRRHYLDTYAPENGESDFDDVRALLEALSGEPARHFEDAWELVAMKRAPAIDAFWDTLWVPFARHLEDDLAAHPSPVAEDPLAWLDAEDDDDAALGRAVTRATDAALAALGLSREEASGTAELIDEKISDLAWNLRETRRAVECPSP